MVGANPSTLVQRLERLEELGVLERTVHSVMPPRTSYALTCAGRGLQDVIDAIERWGRGHLQEAMAAKQQTASTARLDPQTVSRALRSSAAVAQRSAGRCASAFRMMRASSGGMSGLSDVGSGAACRRWTAPSAGRLVES